MIVLDHSKLARSRHITAKNLCIFASLTVLLGGGLDADAKRRRRAKVPDLTKDGQPNIRSEAAYVVELDTGNLVYAKNPDTKREIASTGKIFVAMTVLAKGLDLDARTTITDDDVEAGKGGARSRLAHGQHFTNRDLLAAMLIGSDNRAATALGRAVSLTPSQLTDAMGEIAETLGLTNTSFNDPSGLKGNYSTAREMGQALAAALQFEVISELLGSKSYVVPLSKPIRRQRRLMYRNTNQLLHTDDEVLAGKTGFTSSAGYCLILASHVGSQRLAVVFLGGDGKKTRFADYRRLRRWLSTP